MEVKGVDVSEWQGNIEWNEVDKKEVDFVMLRIGYTGYGKLKQKRVDSFFESNYKKCKESGIKVGGYYYSCATTKEEAIEEAKFVLDTIRGKKFEYPIAIDTEDNHDINNPDNSSESQFSIGKDKLTEVVKAFCDTLEKEGYYVTIYSSLYWLKNRLILDDLTKYDKWVANWSKNAPIGLKYGMWQYSSTGIVEGIGKGVDLDFAYKDYPSLMIKNGLNGYDKPNPIEKPISTEPKPQNPTEKVNIFKVITKYISKVFKWFKKIFKK